jgi:hypothetical protein
MTAGERTTMNIQNGTDPGIEDAQEIVKIDDGVET